MDGNFNKNWKNKNNFCTISTKEKHKSYSINRSLGLAPTPNLIITIIEIEVKYL